MSLAPSRLEHARAFDLATAAWDGSPALAVVSTPEFADLAIARAWGGATLWCDDDRTLAHARARLEGGYLLPTAHAVSGTCLVGAYGSVPTSAPLRHALWAVPQPASWEATLGAIEASMADGGELVILGVTPIGALLRPLRRAVAPGEPAAVIPRLRTRLATHGWRLGPDVRFGGLAGTLWALAARVAAAARRPDLADRAERAHHAAVSSAALGSFVLTRAWRGPAPEAAAR